MNNAQQTTEMMSKLGNQGFDSLRRLGELNVATWSTLIDQQMRSFNTVVDSSLAQMSLLGEGKEPQELVSAQLDLSRKLTEQLVEDGRKSVELAQGAGEEYRSWAESAAKLATEQAESVAETMAA